jgi:dipeptidyl-peptidase-4
MNQQKLSLRLLICSVALLIGSSTSADDRKPLTWEQVYGEDRIVIRDPAPTGFVWLNDTTLLKHDESWAQIDAVSGRNSAFYDAMRLQQRLLDTGISKDDAKEIADGHWTQHNAQLRICVLHTERRLIRAGLDGDRIRVLNGLPEKIELLTLSPTGNACAFVADNDLWCADFGSGTIRQLTHRTGPHIRNGKADWIYYEEVLRRKSKAFRFSPDGRFLVFQQFDDSDVPTFSVVDHAKPTQSIEVEHFPKAGERNPAVKLGIVSVAGGEVVWATSPYNDKTTLITHFGWVPDSSSIYWYAQNRSQTWLDIVRTGVDDNSSSVLLRETTGGWVESPGELRFLRDGSFLMLSERTGWKHVDHVSADGNSRRAITIGLWDVNRIHAVNEESGWIVVTGTRDSTIADDIYRVSLSDGSVIRLSDDVGHHAAVVSPAGTMLVDTWSNHTTRKSVTVRDSTGHVHRNVHQATKPEEWNEYMPANVSVRDISLADEQSGKAIFITPFDFDESQPHPVWLKVYGGPRYARVKDVWKARLTDHLLASQGIVVIYFDPRTAGGHGAAGAWKALHQLGVEETRDVEAVCQWLGEQSWADGKRIGMSGHSYGGYLTSYVMTHSDCIAAGIAGAPVTDWANYDTIYTERYMDTPQNNPKGYRKSSVAAAATNLHGQLLLVHGLRDNNVHSANTFQFVRALQQANKHFELMVYPNAHHGIHAQHYRRLHSRFILKSLGIAQNE